MEQQIRSCKLQKNVKYEELDLLQNCEGNNPEKCEVCLQAKAQESHFQILQGVPICRT